MCIEIASDVEGILAMLSILRNSESSLSIETKFKVEEMSSMLVLMSTFDNI